ncbi:fmt protein [Lactobacillus selangorensis]|uniref:Methionyl-tRNA formyltransferase n=1 Tax=Lactobacillus selangorensis TaxID=81857 RepID=A0A0R2GAQ6_9LACO|nr:methionyl-tRNA formyltransferase [Lactobacillus selangorensis]KRN29650.1 fmt protein [Lactobacillus selangorensis]KRN33821.1 fmt protein [Lactobacillus selangorensis]
MTSIIFMGTPQFSVPILTALNESPDYQVEAVVTQPDRKVGRKQKLSQSPVKQYADEQGLKVFQPQKLSGSPEMQEMIAMAPDLFITAAFGQFLPTKLLQAARIAAINVHGSLLPKYRGGAPVQYSIWKGDAETGDTIMYMVKKMDAGNMIAQVKVPITTEDDNESLFKKLSLAGRDLLMETLPAIVAGTAPSVAQDEAQVTFAYNIKPEEEEINIDQTATQIDQQVRAFRPDPVAYAILDGKRTKLWQVAPVAATTTALAPGTVVAVTKKKLWVAAGAGTVLAIQELQPAGKAKMPIAAYLNGQGQHIQEGDHLIDAPQQD